MANEYNNGQQYGGNQAPVGPNQQPPQPVNYGQPQPVNPGNPQTPGNQPQPNNQYGYGAYDYSNAANSGYFDYGAPQQQQPQNQQPQKPKNKTPFGTKLKNFFVKKWWLVLTIVVLLSVVGVAAYVFWPRETVITEDYVNVSRTIEGPDSLNSGAPDIWNIRVTNREAVAITDVTVNLRFDRTFKFESSLNMEPENIQGTEYKLGDLGAAGTGNSEGLIQIQGVLIGNIDEQSVMQGTVSYTPLPLANEPGNNLVTLEFVPLRTQIEASQLQVTMSPSETSVLNGNEVTMTVIFENLSNDEIDDVRITMTYPDRGGFEYLNSELRLSNTSETITEPSNGNNVWDILTLPRLQDQTLNVTGIIQGADGVKQNFIVEIAFKNAEGIYETLVVKTRDVTVTSQPLILSTSIEGKTPTSTFEPGESLTFTIDFQNRSNRTLKNLEILGYVDDPADILDYGTITYEGGVGNINNRAVEWLANGVPQLETFPPQTTGTLSYSIDVKDEEDFVQTNLKQSDYTLRPRAEAKAANQQTVQFDGDVYKAGGELIFSQQIEEVESSDPNQNIRRFKVTWTLNSRQNQINNIAVETRSTLPPSSWIANSIQPSSNSEEISYQENNGRISWRPGSIPSYTGISNSPKTISFELEFNASSTGNRNLYEEVDISGVDSFTGQLYQFNSAEGQIR